MTSVAAEKTLGREHTRSLRRNKDAFADIAAILYLPKQKICDVSSRNARETPE